MTDQFMSEASMLAPIIEKVHGGHHPELTRVREITEELARADSATDTRSLFGALRTLTDDYTVPGDVCESVEATYRALSRADRAAQLADA